MTMMTSRDLPESPATSDPPFRSPLRDLSARTFGFDRPSGELERRRGAGIKEPRAHDEPPRTSRRQASETEGPAPIDHSVPAADRDQTLALKELLRHAAEIHVLLRRLAERDRAAVFAGPVLND